MIWKRQRKRWSRAWTRFLEVVDINQIIFMINKILSPQRIVNFVLSFWWKLRSVLELTNHKVGGCLQKHKMQMINTRKRIRFCEVFSRSLKRVMEYRLSDNKSGKPAQLGWEGQSQMLRRNHYSLPDQLFVAREENCEDRGEWGAIKTNFCKSCFFVSTSLTPPPSPRKLGFLPWIYPAKGGQICHKNSDL